MKRTPIQQLRYITRKNHKRYRNSLKRTNRNSSQPRTSYKPSEKKENNKKVRDFQRPEVNYSEILKFLLSDNNHFSKQSPNHDHDGILTVPKIFSLNRNPKESYKFLKDLLFTLRYPRNRKIKLDYSVCEELDLGASITMDIILQEFIKYFTALSNGGHRVPVTSIEGINMDNEKVKKFLFSTGANNTIRGIQTNFPDILTYPLRIGQRGINIGQKEIESTKLVEHIEQCLGKMDKVLRQESREKLADIIGEVLTNAENHSSTQYRYSIGHFEVPDKNTSDTGVFQFVIFNFGQTIYQRLKDSNYCLNRQILEDMEALSRRYTERFLLGIGKNKILEETLWTLYTLQDGVSCISPHRGNGTIRFIESFLELKGDQIDNSSKMVLLSGNTKIMFDGTYSTIEKINAEGEMHKVITFNKSGTLYDRPDEKFVSFVDNFFPGTMLYARIHIKRENLENEHN